jgi:hypothetical protein
MSTDNKLVFSVVKDLDLRRGATEERYIKQNKMSIQKCIIYVFIITFVLSLAAARICFPCCPRLAAVKAL